MMMWMLMLILIVDLAVDVDGDLRAAALRDDVRVLAARVVLDDRLLDRVANRYS